MAVTTMIGASIQRREDPRLVTGHGAYIDDLTRPQMVHMTVVRSPFAHASIRGVDIAAARSAPGVVAVLTAADFRAVIGGGIPVANAFVPDKAQVPDQFHVAESEAIYQGEAIAV